MELSVYMAFAAHQCCKPPRLDLHSASSSSRRGFQPLSTFLPAYTHMQRAKLHDSTYNGVCSMDTVTVVLKDKEREHDSTYNGVCSTDTVTVVLKHRQGKGGMVAATILSRSALCKLLRQSAAWECPSLSGEYS